MVRAVQTRSSVGRVSPPSAAVFRRPAAAVLRRPAAAVLRRSSAAVVDNEVETVTVKGTTYPLPEGFTKEIANQVIMIEVDTKKTVRFSFQCIVSLLDFHVAFLFFFLNTHNFGHHF